MGMFQRMRDGMIRFMYGRNGMDQLNRALLAVYLVICVLRALFLTGRPNAAGSAALSNLLITALALLIFFRMFSKNLYKRREENQRWANWWWSVKNKSAGARARHADKDHKYFTCKSCKAICRVPVGKGKIVITCPKCGAQINART